MALTTAFTLTLALTVIATTFAWCARFTLLARLGRRTFWALVAFTRALSTAVTATATIAALATSTFTSAFAASLSAFAISAFTTAFAAAFAFVFFGGLCLRRRC